MTIRKIRDIIEYTRVLRSNFADWSFNRSNFEPAHPLDYIWNSVIRSLELSNFRIEGFSTFSLTANPANNSKLLTIEIFRTDLNNVSNTMLPFKVLKWSIWQTGFANRFLVFSLPEGNKPQSSSYCSTFGSSNKAALLDWLERSTALFDLVVGSS